MAQKKVWEFEGDWYIQVGENLPFCINTEEVANELANHISKQVEKPVKSANDNHAIKYAINELTTLEGLLLEAREMDAKTLNKAISILSQLRNRLHNRLLV